MGLLIRTAAAAMIMRKVPVSSWFQKSRMYMRTPPKLKSSSS